LAAASTTITAMSTQLEKSQSEGTDLRRQLATWQEKASKISRMQTQERIRFDNSTDLIAQARVDLTKALNENAKMKAQIHDLEVESSEKGKTLEYLDETISIQAEKMAGLVKRLKESSEELALSTNEKQRLEEDMAIITASKEGADITETLRQVEQDKARWLEEREHALEAKRRALDEESDRLLERERKRNRQDSEALFEISARTRRKEEEQQRLKQSIDKQISDMKVANKDLQERIAEQSAESKLETKKHDHSTATLEQEISKLRRHLAASQLREQERELQKKHFIHDETALEDVKKENRTLKRNVQKLEKQVEGLRLQSNDWKEIVLPGHRGIRGVTFGETSESLAGFLTILVDEQKRKHARQKPSKQTKDIHTKKDSRRSNQRKAGKSAAPKRAKKAVKAKKQASKKKRKKGDRKAGNAVTKASRSQPTQSRAKGKIQKKARKRQRKHEDDASTGTFSDRIVSQDAIISQLLIVPLIRLRLQGYSSSGSSDRSKPDQRHMRDESFSNYSVSYVEGHL